MYQPPLALMVRPVMKSLSARRRATRPISSGEPKKPTGMRSVDALGLDVIMSVSTRAGAMALQVMPSLARSEA